MPKILTEDQRAEILEKLGQLVQRLRESHDFTQEELAEILDIPRSGVSLMEDGKRGFDAPEIVKLSKVFHKEPNELLKPGMEVKSHVRNSNPPMSENQTPIFYPSIQWVFSEAGRLGIKTSEEARLEGEDVLLASVDCFPGLNKIQAAHMLCDNIQYEFPAAQAYLSKETNETCTINFVTHAEANIQHESQPLKAAYAVIKRIKNNIINQQADMNVMMKSILSKPSKQGEAYNEHGLNFDSLSGTFQTVSKAINTAVNKLFEAEKEISMALRIQNYKQRIEDGEPEPQDRPDSEQIKP